MGHYELLLHTNKGCNQMIQGQKNSISHKEPNDFKKKGSQTSKQWGPFDRECTLTNNYTPVSQKSYVY